MNTRDVVIGATMGSALVLLLDPVRGRWRSWSTGPVDDRSLLTRTRAALRDVAWHDAIEIEAQNGCITVRGRLLASEANAVVAAIAAVPGVVDVADELDGPGGIDAVPPSPRRRAPARRAVIGAGLLAAGVWMAVTATRAGHRHAFNGGYVDAAM